MVSQIVLADSPCSGVARTGDTEFSFACLGQCARWDVAKMRQEHPEICSKMRKKSILISVILIIVSLDQITKVTDKQFCTEVLLYYIIYFI